MVTHHVNHKLKCEAHVYRWNTVTWPLLLVHCTTINLSGNQDFLLVINSNLGPISHRFRDTATYWLKIANFSYPLSFSALV